ncbi:hypothetical protein LTR10_011512 [Elasticomyces elasticus]|uniref:EF-hand domain-containing protein n=1 Tax=Exophiala sideris TaxID=1016849 RepID=A0ABR0JCN8_9EURO|nr:hypothetical protein LTR10_011512 [Elasticomyces elasticus]KAK5032030.1 hypothetical protein LTS07_004652 [Exophiala sideris]KAK5040959.1 hypothetical protein LTR13_003261 [Exophiala sideris]KAK5061707.1 hypothetical protein LTR69_004889 [Exophiala sideris]KAK5184407.1 hypothetical protein LTR44_003080 [Eurotiomycetes sp. CCFEE 6388]
MSLFGTARDSIPVWNPHALPVHFDATQFSEEIQQALSDSENGHIDQEQYNEFLEFLWAVTNSEVDVSHDEALVNGMKVLGDDVRPYESSLKGDYTVGQVNSVVDTLISQHYCANIFGFLLSMNHESIDFSHVDQVQSTMNSVAALLNAHAGSTDSNSLQEIFSQNPGLLHNYEPTLQGLENSVNGAI